MENFNYDILFVGAGITNLTIANIIAHSTSRPLKMLMIDRRDHIGGNCYTEKMHGIDVHKYGAHIFHTSDKEIADYVKQFGNWHNYINQPVYHYVDTTIYNPVYIDVPYRDTIIVNIDTVYTICTTDTIINTVVDTVINNVHDTTIVYSYDTIYLPVYDTVYIHDTVYVGINDAAQNDNINVYQSGNQIVVNGTEGNVVRLFDAVGRMLATKQDPYGEVYFEAPATGTYLVKVGNYQAKRIVVVL
jgi:UDP-galactopyranose mutase